jgi:CelD/BcsL family acetyltransferase involved in cellulose biosynthesis
MATSRTSMPRFLALWRRYRHYSLLIFLCKGRQTSKNVNNFLWADFAMTTAAAIERRTAEVTNCSKASRISRVEILSDLVQAEAIWRGLEGPQHFSTPFQRFDFLAPWQQKVGERKGLQPFIIVAYDADRRPLLLLPLALCQKYGIRTACFMGGKHATFNMALWDGDFAATVTPGDLHALMSAIRKQSRADVLALTQQPTRWRDAPNPMALLPSQASVNDCPLMLIAPGAPTETLIDPALRRELKSKERKLRKLSGYRYHVASGSTEIKRLLDWFFRLKPLRMTKQKLPNAFAEPGIEDFLYAACTAPIASGGHVIDIHAIECDEEVIAIFAGVSDGQRFSTMFNTYTMSDNSRHSPGLVLLRNIVDHYAELAYRAFDLGVGTDGYKKLFCKSDEPIFDSFIPLSARGNVAARAMSGVHRAKHLVKHHQALFYIAQRLRTTLYR